MYLIIGLGNPGREYSRTRHNVGFMALDAFASRENIAYSRSGFNAVYGEGRLGGERIVIAKPETFMNNSGFAAAQLVNWYKTPMERLIVVYDDIDLPCGAIRIRGSGSAGTHNGMRSIVEQLGREDFPRIRIGIGKPPHDLISYVLGVPGEEERKLLNKAYSDAAKALELIISGHLEAAQTEFNYKPPKTARETEPRAPVYAPIRLPEESAISGLGLGREVFFVNSHTNINDDFLEGGPLSAAFPYGMADILEAENRLRRFAPLIARLFPEIPGGIIESPITEAKRLRSALPGGARPGRLFIKQDSELGIAGSVKARGGIYEVLKHTEDIAIAHSLLSRDERGELTGYESLAGHGDIFGKYSIQVGSTGNLGLSIGIMSAAIGYRVSVHMSADAAQWKKELLRSKGAEVVEYAGDYGKAVSMGRAACEADPMCYFIDDERSKDLFFGYSTAALRLKAQLMELGVRVDREHPLIVHLPCGVGGAPGGIAFGLKAVFGESVRCFFIEPVNAPCMLAAFLQGKCVSVSELGLSGRTEADGLAVGRASELAYAAMRSLMDGEFTVDDSRLLPWLRLIHGTEGIFVEPSAAAMLSGAIGLSSPAGAEYLKASGIPFENAAEVLWATGGGLVPERERRRLLKGRGANA